MPPWASKSFCGIQGRTFTFEGRPLGIRPLGKKEETLELQSLDLQKFRVTVIVMQYRRFISLKNLDPIFGGRPILSISVTGSIFGIPA